MSLLDVLVQVVQAVIRYLRYDWWILAVGIGTAVILKVYLGEKLEAALKRKAGITVIGAVGAGAFTPLCACGTMAVLLSMFISSLPWGTVMAFLITSPLTSPTQFIFQAGFLGYPLAIAGLASAIILGLGAGVIATILDRKTGFFRGQYRLAPRNCSACAAAPEVACCGARPAVKRNLFKRLKLDQVIKQVYELGVKRVLVYFILFIALGRMVEMFVPAETILLFFSPDKFYSIPLAAIIGLPLYVSGAAGLPLLESFLAAGASEAAVLAFLIAGQGCSIGVMVGIATFMKKRAIAFYSAFVLVGSMVAGLVYQVIIAFI